MKWLERFIKAMPILLVASVVAFVVWTATNISPEVAERTLKSQNYRDVTVTGKSWFAPGCTKGSAVQFRAVATNERGEQVRVGVCVSWFQNATTVVIFP